MSSLLNDFCVDTFAPSHLPGKLKQLKQQLAQLTSSYVFELFRVETLGPSPWGPRAHVVYKDIDKGLVDFLRDQRLIT